MKIERISAYRLSATETKKIDQFIDDNNGLVFHYVEFNKIAAGFCKTELEYWLAVDNDRLVGICPAHFVKKGMLKHFESGLTGFEIPYGGWVHIPEVDSLRLLKSTKLHYNESLLISTNFLDEEYGLSGSSLIRETAFIDFRDTDLLSIWGRFDSKRRNMVRKAEKSSVQVHVLNTDNIKDFYELLMNMNSRTSLSSKNEEYYRGIYHLLGPEKACIMVAYLKNEPVSSVMLVGNDNVWHYWQGATDTRFNVGAGELLQWMAIQYAFSRGTKLYDMCVIERNMLPKLASFKLSFGAKPVEYRFVSIRPISVRLLQRGARMVDKWK